MHTLTSLLLSIIFITTGCWAQKATTTNADSIAAPTSSCKNALKFTPFKLLGIVNPAFEVCYERRMAPRFATQFMAGYLLPQHIINPRTGFSPNISGYRLAIEEKLYDQGDALNGFYLSAEVNYLNTRYHSISDFTMRDTVGINPDLIVYRDTFGIKKQTLTFNFKLGYQAIYKHFSFECYMGLGLRYRQVEHFDRINPSDKMVAPRHPNLIYAMDVESEGWVICIPLNMRIGWAF